MSAPPEPTKTRERQGPMPPPPADAGGAGEIVAFFVLAFALAWASWAVALALPRLAPRLADLRGVVFLLGVFAPSWAALALTARRGGASAVRRLLGRILRVEAPLACYAFALALVATVKLVAALLERVASGAWPRFGAEPWPLLLIATVLSTPAQAGEEVGWRGFVLPRLAARLGWGGAAVLLGVLWAAWHLPLFFVPGGDTYGQSFPLYLLQVTALSVALAWLYWRSRGSLPLVMLLHAAANNTKDIVPSALPGAHDPLSLAGSQVGWLTVGLLWLVAVALLLDLRRAPRPAPGDPWL